MNVGGPTSGYATSTGANSNGGVVYLDRHRAYCSDNTLMTKWKIANVNLGVRSDCRGYNVKNYRCEDRYNWGVRIDFICRGYNVKNYRCEDRYTDLNDPGNGIVYLDRHWAMCRDNEALRGFEGQTGCRNWAWWGCRENGFRFKYVCCSANTFDPTPLPIASPTSNPISNPTLLPTMQPVADPTMNPTETPISNPTQLPTENPISNPTQQPTFEPTHQPSHDPTLEPTFHPSPHPSHEPTLEPVAHPTHEPTKEPTGAPVVKPVPTQEPIANPTMQPTPEPSHTPTFEPTHKPSDAPTFKPSHSPTIEPSANPTLQPTFEPTKQPVAQPTFEPSHQPSLAPTFKPTHQPTFEPTLNPIPNPTESPVAKPTFEPTFKPTHTPTLEPTLGKPPKGMSAEDAKDLIELGKEQNEDEAEEKEIAAQAEEKAPEPEVIKPNELQPKREEPAAPVEPPKIRAHDKVCKFTYTSKGGEISVPQYCAIVSNSELTHLEVGKTAEAIYICGSGENKMGEAELAEALGETSISTIIPGQYTTVTFYSTSDFTGNPIKFTSHFHPDITQIHFPGIIDAGNDDTKSLIFNSEGSPDPYPKECYPQE